MQAHPDKRKVGLPGEDAFFCCSDGSLAVAGVADGTSAAGTPSLLCTQHRRPAGQPRLTPARPADGGVYARRLMEQASAAALGALETGSAEPEPLLHEAWQSAGKMVRC